MYMDPLWMHAVAIIAVIVVSPLIGSWGWKTAWAASGKCTGKFWNNEF